ncbi:PREDICTED: putative odorant-binding protein A10 [Diuraphis noxia]|uniref:putative odorant-binding protein A10 n=1 Tax=Diuraphis noxia TaxID=143948 RepID=UPI0007636EDC|nr:PREDICTED: putative odorant-binding protein A10 [Diuraphis noxia]
MARSSSNITMKVFVIAISVCAALARPDDTKVEIKPAVFKSETLASPLPMTIVKRATPQVVSTQQDSSLPNVSEDVLEKALSDRRFVLRQLKCATGEGPCDPIGRKIKAHAPLVLRGMCVKCSQSEIKQIQRVMSHIQKNYPKEYTKMLKQYQSGI